MTRLSVNINKIATLRNSRGGNIPDVLKAAVLCQEYGAEGITVHPRPDERHIKYQDVYDISKIIKTEFNIEGYPSSGFIDLCMKVVPDQVTLVPDPPNALTSSEGWDTIEHEEILREVIQKLKSKGIRVSVFTGTDLRFIEGARKVGADRVELYTEPYAAGFDLDAETAVAPFTNAARLAAEVGLGLNAGHDLNLQNLKYFNDHVPGLLEVSIGHALIADALYFGLQNTIQMYLQKIR